MAGAGRPVAGAGADGARQHRLGRALRAGGDRMTRPAASARAGGMATDHARSRGAVSRPPVDHRRPGTGCARPRTGCAKRCSISSGPSVGGALVLDGFAGTGAVGIEALSRGAAQVAFVDEDPRADALDRGESGAAGHARTSQCYYPRGFADAAARLLAAEDFDIVVLDPPYGEPRWPRRFTRRRGWSPRAAGPSSSTRARHRRRRRARDLRLPPHGQGRRQLAYLFMKP